MSGKFYNATIVKIEYGKYGDTPKIVFGYYARNRGNFFRTYHIDTTSAEGFKERLLESGIKKIVV